MAKIHPQNFQAFTHQADKYFQDNYWRPDEEYLVNKYFQPGKEILVLGCGAGRTLVPLYNYGLKITAIDIVPKMVEKARQRIGERPIKIMQMDACRLEFADNYFDYAFFPFHGIDCIYPDIYKAVEEVARVLKPGGTFIFNSHHRLALKALKHFFKGKYAQAGSLFVYRSTYLDYFKLKRYFKRVKIKHRIAMLPWRKANWKDVCYKIFLPLDRSLYFICREPKKPNQ